MFLTSSGRWYKSTTMRWAPAPPSCTCYPTLSTWQSRLQTCSSCLRTLTQPLGWRKTSSGRLSLPQRCPVMAAKCHAHLPLATVCGC